jgi:hypothetical protein
LLFTGFFLPWLKTIEMFRNPGTELEDALGRKYAKNIVNKD